MRKHHLRNSINSLLGSHINIEKEEQLKGSKSEIEVKVKKALKLLKDEDLGEKDGFEAGGPKKEPLAELIEDLHQKYESLYAQYDHLTGDLKKTVHAKQDQGSSSSSDSESDSSIDRGSKNGYLENDFQRTIESCRQELEITNAENADLRRKLTDANSKNEALGVEYQMVLSKLREAEENYKSSQTDAQRLDDEKSRIALENKDLHQKLDIAANTGTDLNQRLEDAGREKSNLMTEEKTVLHRIQQEKEGLEAKNTELEKVFTERDAECLALKGKLEQEGMETFAQITHLTTQVSSLKQELDTLQTLKNQMEQKFEVQKEFSESLKELENQKMELTNKLVEQEKLLKEQEDVRENLLQENKQIEASLQDCQVRLQDAEKKMGLMAEQFRKKSGSKESMVSYLEDIIEDLKRDLEVKKDEVHTLVENARTIEVKLRLSNQKIRITEQLLSEKEESFKELEVKYQQKVTVLEERIAELSQALDSHQNMIRNISEHVNIKLTGLETMIDKFSEKYEHYKYFILEVLNELQIVKNCTTRTRNEKEQLSQAVNQLTAQLVNEKDLHLSLKKQVETLKEKSGNEKGEMKNLTKDENDLEKKIEAMERNILALEEEKREAIRQLCMWVDYHRSRYDCLKEIMSRDTVRNRRPA